ncbi:MAG TPA: MlaD family protein [Verrucomicrobiae bacterium]|nr:MlaD family protein [Verrucomicrobiae bacterium]
MSASGRTVGQNDIFEVLTGAAVVAVALLFLGFTYMRTGSGSLSGYEVLAKLPKVDGLGDGTDVRISGIKVGSVTEMDLDPNNFLVTVHMSIRPDIKLPTDSALLINQAGFLGSQYLSILPGGDDKNIAPGGMIINVQAANTNDVVNLVGRAASGAGGQPAAPKPQQPSQPGPSP